MKVQRFRKKPVEIDAVRVPLYSEYSADIKAYLDDAIALADWCEGGVGHLMNMDDEDGGPHLLIHTLEGTMRAQPGDWVIRGVEGEFYPCKPEIFAKTYDEVVA